MSINGSNTLVLAGQIQFVVGAEGKPTAVLLDIAVWERVLQALEDAEDLEIAKQALAELAAVGGDPEKAGYLSWDQARAELEATNAQE
jgi:hypothetical protein